jgi:activator of 2-hydroxyglutaryl-CoA dehydratase
VRVEPECTLVGGILQIEAMVRLLRERLAIPVNVPAGDSVLFSGAVGACVLGLRRLARGSAAQVAASGERHELHR